MKVDLLNRENMEKIGNQEKIEKKGKIEKNEKYKNMKQMKKMKKMKKMEKIQKKQANMEGIEGMEIERRKRRDTNPHEGKMNSRDISMNNVNRRALIGNSKTDNPKKFEVPSGEIQNLQQIIEEAKLNQLLHDFAKITSELTELKSLHINQTHFPGKSWGKIGKSFDRHIDRRVENSKVHTNMVHLNSLQLLSDDQSVVDLS